jgi:hypothetical protein
VIPTIRGGDHVAVELTREDFDPDLDWDTVVIAGAGVMRVVADLAYHNTNPGEGWDPFAEPGDVPALITEIRGRVEQLEEAIKKARGEIAHVERVARLRAARRERATRA